MRYGDAKALILALVIGSWLGCGDSTSTPVKDSGPVDDQGVVVDQKVFPDRSFPEQGPPPDKGVVDQKVSADKGPTSDQAVDQVVAPDQAIKPDTNVASITVTPTTAKTFVGAAALAPLKATLNNATGTIAWTLVGPGSISPATGATTTYTPPNRGAPGTATITAKAGTLTDQSVIDVTAPPRRTIIAYANASNPTAASYFPTFAYSNRTGAITAKRAAKGQYTVTFTNQLFTGINVQVSSQVQHARCSVAGWTTDSVSVRCFAHTGAYDDSPFFLSVVAKAPQASGTANVVAYAWAGQPTTASYALVAPYAFNSAGGAMTVTRAMAGSYSVLFTGLGSASGVSHATAYNSNKHCGVGSYSGTSTFSVRCFDSGGILSDSAFTMSFIARTPTGKFATPIAFAWADKPGTASYAPNSAHSYSASGQAPVATRSGSGTYQMRFPGLQVSAGTVDVSAYGSVKCGVVSWGGDAIKIQCHDRSGVLIDSAYTVRYSIDANP